MKRKIVLFIGRFQPFHKGHQFVIQELRPEYELKLGIGSSKKKRTLENPLSSEERKRVIENCFPEIEVFKVPDFNSDGRWVKEVLKRVDFDFVVSGNPHVRECFQKFSIEVKKPPLFEPERYEGEVIRERILKGKAWEELVPECSLEVLEELNFEEIIKEASL